MSGRGDDKSIEPAHQPYVPPYQPALSILKQPVELPWTGNSTAVPSAVHIAEMLTEARVRRIAEEVAGKLVADLERRIDAHFVTPATTPAPPRGAEGWKPRRHKAGCEAGWAVMDNEGRLLTDACGFKHNPKPDEVRWLGREPVNQYMMDAHAVFLDKATLRQVQLPKAEEQKEPPRETGWAVVLDSDLVLVGKVSFARRKDAHATVLWLSSRAEAETLARLLGVGRAAELYKDTLEEVEA